MKRKSYCERGKKVIAEKKFDLSVIARSKATKQSREGTCLHWIASLRSQ